MKTKTKAEPPAKAATYHVTSRPGMTPWCSVCYSLPDAIAQSVRARREGLEGEIIAVDGAATMDATPADCDDAARLLGWQRDPASEDMDRPVNANVVASDLAGGAS